MNLSMEGNGDAYMKIDHRKHWKPHLEMLVRAGVAEYHPDNKHIRLVNFYSYALLHIFIVEMGLKLRHMT